MKQRQSVAGNKLERCAAVLSVCLAIFQVILVLASWIVNSAAPHLHVRSLLGSEGLRWFLGGFTSMMASPLLVWAILLFVAFGAFDASGLKGTVSSLARSRRLSFRQKHALWLVALTLMAFVSVMIVLTCIPHAILLSSTGRLFPGIFSAGIVPVSAFALTVMSVVYGFSSGNMRSLTDIFHALASGFTYFPYFCLLYILSMQLFCSVLYVFNISAINVAFC